MNSAAKVIFCLALTIFANLANAQQVFKTTQPSTIAYYEYLPQDYSSNSDKYPVMIFLHGIGERGPNTTDPAKLEASIYEVAKLGPPMYVKNGTQFPFILISPQLKDNYGTWPSSYVLEVINHVKSYLRIDERRIYLTGLSLGGGGTWVTAQDYPELFAAIAPVCGGYNSPSKACGIAAENVAVWAFHGDSDTTVPYSRSVNMVNAINACVPAPSPLAKMTLYPGVNHNAWTKAYKTDNSVHNPNVYQWITTFTNTVKKGTKVPIANAGLDKTVAVGSTTLKGTGSDSDGSIVAYQWKQISGPNTSVLSSATVASPTLSNLIVGAYTYRLTVTDNAGVTDSDYVKINVTANTLPTVNAGADRSITLPTSSASITATASDADGTVTSYAWSKVSGGSATLSGTNASTLSCSALVEGSYVFRVTVTDNLGGKKSDDVALTVNPAPNALPTVNAGADKVITLPTNSVSITATASDSDGTIASYSWTKISGGNSTLTGTSTATLTASAMTEGTYTFRLTVIDNNGGQKSDDVAVSVNPVPSNNSAPVAKAGLDKVITLPTRAITIVGSGFDADGTVASYSWTKVYGPAASLSNITTSKLWAYNLVEGIYSFRLTVTDNLGATSTDDMILTVQGESGGTTMPNVAPVANAGPDKTITLPTRAITILGGGTDADGTIASYLWTKVSGPSGSMSNTTTSKLWASNLVEGTYTFRLTVTDDKGASASDDMTLVVAPEPVVTPNIAPTVTAGPDKTITLPTKAITIVGTASDADGVISSYTWTQVSGATASMSNTSTAKLWAYNLTVGTYVFRLTVKDDDGVSRYDDMTLSVKDAVTTAASFSAEIEEVLDVNEEKVLGNLSMTELENSTVVVFNEAGKKIYAGSWSATSQQEVMNHSGLYIYNVIRQGKRMESGKIYVR
ncbi:MAG TPA: PKD domain-containing protein [Chryseosolibacter sp.]